jgi:putative membrane protein insertion efficiency factor
MKGRLSTWLWTIASPVRMGLVWMIRGYRATVGHFMGGRCRFYPSCSAYAEQAISRAGVIRGLGLAVWRVLRCSPLSKGGVDHPPRGRVPVNDNVIHPPRMDTPSGAAA